MAELYFKVGSDWEEVVKLRNEITRLENQLNQFNGKAPLEVLDKLCNELVSAKSRLTELVEAAAVEGAKLDSAFKKSITIDVSTPMGQLKAFDDELQKMSSNLNAYFDTLKGKLQEMVAVLGDGKTIADNIKVNEENLAKIDELNRLNAELKEQIKQIQSELDRQQAAWQQVQDTISGNKQAVDGLTQSQQQQAQASAEAAMKMNAALDDEVRKNEAAKKSWDDKKAEIESLQAELQKYQQQYDSVLQLKPDDGKLKRWWRETQFASAANGGEVDEATIQHVVGLNSKIEELKQKLKDAQKEEKTLSDQFNSSSQRVDELRDSINSTLSPLQQMQKAEDAASKALRLEEARGMLRGITQEMDAAIDKMRTLEGDAERYRDYISKLENGDTSVLKNGQDAATELASARAELEKCEAELEKQKKDYNDLANLQEKYKQQIVDSSGHQARMRTQIMNAREELMKMIADGKTGTPEFQQLAEKAGDMRKQMQLANATMQYFANPTRHLEGLKTAMQGVAGAASLATGVMGVFNTNSEKMAAIQTKIQSYLGIIIGLESAYATVKKTSNAMLLISEVQTRALAKAKAYETVATNAGTLATLKAAAAQAYFNTIANMNPYLLLVTGIGLVCGAVWGLTKVLRSESEEEKKIHEERQKRIQEIRDAHEKWANDVAGSAGKQIATYERLRRKWNELGDNLKEKQKLVKENQDAFHDLGWAVNGVSDAEKLFTQNTQAVVNAIIARAKAVAYQTAIADEYAKSIKKRDQIDNTVAGGGYRRVFKEGEVISQDERERLNKQYGINLRQATMGGGTVPENERLGGAAGFMRTDVTLTAANAAYLNSLEAQDAAKRWKANIEALDKETEQRIDYLTKGLTNAVAEQENAMKKVGVGEWNGGNGSGGRGKTADDIAKEQMLHDQELARQHRDNQMLEEQATIDQMEDGADKEIRQMQLNHKKRMAELDDEQEALLNKKREQASVDSKGNKRKGFYSSGAYSSVNLSGDELSGVNAKRVSENEAYADSVVALFKKITSGSENTEDMMKRLRTVYSGFVSDINSITEQTASDGSELFKNILSHVEEQFDRSQAEIRRMELQSMRDYLKDYGSFEQQKLAVTQIYEERIKKAKTEGERLRLQKEQQQAISSLTVNNAMMGIDWSALLQGVGSLSQDMMKPMLERLETIMNSEEFNNADIREREKIVELVSQMRQYVGTDQSVTWQQLATAISKFQSAVDSFNKAESDEKAALQRLADARQKREKGEITQSDFEKIEREANELGQKTVEARDEMQRLGKTLNETSDQVANAVSPLTAALNNAKAWQGVDGFSQLKGASQNMDELQNTLNSILPSMGEGMAKTIGSGLSSAIGSMSSVLGSGLESVLSSGIGSMIGIIAQIPKMILQIAEIIKNVVTGILDAITTILKLEWVSDLVNSILEAIGNLIDAIFDLPENIAHLLESIVVDGVGGLVDGVIGRVGNVLSFGALSSKGISDWFTNGNEEEVAETSKALTEENERLRKSIDRLNDSMNKKSGIAAIKDYEQLVSQQRKVNTNLMKEIDNQMGYHSAHHSNNYYASDNTVRSWQGRLNALFREHANDYGKNSVGDVDLSSGIGAIYNLTPEHLAIIRDYASDIWEYLTTVGKYDKSEYWENAADAAGQVQEITKSLYQNLTQMSFDTLKDNFLSSLMDMSNDWDDTLDGMMDNFEEMFRKAALNFALSSVNQELQTFWEDWGERMKAGTELTEADIAEYKRRYQELVEKGLAERERIADITGYDETNAKRQEADKKGFAGMSQDLGEELNGRFTAVQIAGENVSAQMNVAVPILTGIGVSASRTADMVEGIGRVADDMLTNIVECYSELNMIRITTDEMLPIMKENKKTLEKIEKNTKNI